MPDQNGWTRVEEPKGWTLVEPAKPTESKSTLSQAVDAGLMDNPSLGPLDRAGMWLARAVKAHPAQAGAMAAGALAAPVLAPLAAPLAIAGVGAAGALGAGAGQLVSGARPNLRTMATEGALQAGGEGVGRLAGVAARAVAPKAQGLAVSAYERMLKPNKSTLEVMPAFGNNLEQRSENVAKALIQDPNGQISKIGANRYADATSAIGDKVNEIVDANPEARGSTSHLTEALDAGRNKFARQWAPSGDTGAYDTVANEVTQNPAVTKIKRGVVDKIDTDLFGRMTDRQAVEPVGTEMIPRLRAASARDLTQGTYRSLGDQAYGELKGAATEAHKAAARGGRELLNEAIPAVEPLNNDISKRIDLGQILDEAVFRSGKHDPIGLGQQVMLAGKTGGLPLSLLNRPGIGGPLARGMYQAGGQMAQSSGQTVANAMRAALVARLLGESENR